MIRGGFKNMNADKIIQCILAAMLKLEKSVSQNFPKFKIKLEDSFDYVSAQNLIGENQIIPISADGKASIVLENNSLLSLNGISYDNITGNSVAEIPHPGKPYFIFNATDNPVTLNHNTGTPSNFYKPFRFYNGEDLVLPPGGMAEFKFNDTSNTFDKVPGGDSAIVINDLTTGGTTDALSAEMGKFLKSLIDSIYQPNVLISSVPPTRSGNTFTYPNGQYVALINKTIRTNNAAFSPTITTASTINHKRIDLVYFKSDNTLAIVTGTEDISTAQRPTLPANAVAVSFISIIGNTVYDPTTITDELSIQDSLGLEMFKVSNYLRIKGASFSIGAKQIEIDPLVPLSAFLNPITGNDITAALENANKPFKTMTALINALPSTTGETYNIYLSGGTIPITRLMPMRNLRFIAYTAATLDFTNLLLDDGVTQSTYIIRGTTGSGIWTFENGNISIISNYVGQKGFSNANETTAPVLMGSIFNLNWKSPGSSPQRSVILHTGTNIYIENVYDSPQNVGLFTAPNGAATITINNLFLQYKRRFNDGGTIDYDIKNINQVGTTTNGQVINLGGRNCKIGNITATGAVQPRASVKLDVNGVLSAGAYFDFVGTPIVSGNIESTLYNTNQSIESSQTFRNFKGKLTNIVLLNTGLVVFENSIINVFDNLVNRLTGSTREEALWFQGSNTVIQDNILTASYNLVRTQSTSALVTITDYGTTKTNVASFGTNARYVYAASTFKEELNKVVIRSKIDLLKPLSSTNKYIIDVNITDFAANDQVIVPATGLTFGGNGIENSVLGKTVAGLPLFKSASGGSGNIIFSDIKLIAPLGDVFDLVDSNGTHAIELNDVNFENCKSWGKIKGYRQFTGQTIGCYGCENGLTVSGAWDGFSITKLHVRTLAATGTLFKKDIDTTFVNRFFIDSLNISGNTGIKVADFDPAIFSANELFQISNSIFKVAGVVDESNTAGLIPNIDANDPKARWTNSSGIKLTAFTFLDLKSPDGNIWRVAVSNAGALTITDL